MSNRNQGKFQTQDIKNQQLIEFKNLMKLIKFYPISKTKLINHFYKLPTIQ